MESVAHRATRRNPQAVTEGADSFRRLLGRPLTPPLRSQPLLKCLKQFVQAGSQAAHANLELLMPRVGVYSGAKTASCKVVSSLKRQFLATTCWKLGAATCNLASGRLGVFPDRLPLVACYFNVATSSSNCSNGSFIPPLVLPEAIAASNASFEG